MSKDTLNVSGVTYTTAEAGCFEKRRLRQSAGIWGLWGLAAGAAISFTFAIVVSIISIGILLAFSAMAAFSGLFSVGNLFDIAP